MKLNEPFALVVIGNWVTNALANLEGYCGSEILTISSFTIWLSFFSTFHLFFYTL